eukprot:1449523-Pleurochrysis_carterae.AAC.1
MCACRAPVRVLLVPRTRGAKDAECQNTGVQGKALRPLRRENQHALWVLSYTATRDEWEIAEGLCKCSDISRSSEHGSHGLLPLPAYF